MSVISRSALESSSLADLHEIASELGLDGYRRLRKADLVGAIIERQGGDDADGDDAPATTTEDDGAARPRRSRRGGRGRGRARDSDPGDTDGDAGDAGEAGEARPSRSRRSRGDENGDRDRDGGRERSSRSRSRSRGEDRPERADTEERVATGTVELLANGSGFLRVKPPEPSDDDVYISAAQVRRCELVSGDEVAGPVRLPRRSERYPSLIRIDTINGRSADEVAEGTKYDDLPCAYAAERLAFDADDDPTLKAIEWLTPLGRGSRVVIAGAPRAGKTEALRRLAGAHARQDDLECSVVLAGVRPEEIGDWKAGPLQPVVELGLGVAQDAHGQAIERAV
ncbi:MAG: transcription termination factor Rho, partial [Solirubrobacteraceae bacterium]|nr:transcription termination factor Rho [Solirubrobacteraceae bacterium]